MFTLPDGCVFRADGGSRMGGGHVMRCLALAQAMRTAAGRPVFLMAPGARELEKRLETRDMTVQPIAARPGSVEDAMETAAIARRLDASWIVVDGYHFDGDYQRAIKDQGLRLLFLDDTGHADRYCADLVLNQNLRASERMYTNREPATRLLLGVDYVLLREEFLRFRGRPRRIPAQAHRVLVTMGGGDHRNVTDKVLRSLRRIETPKLEIQVVVGCMNPHYDGLRSTAEASRPPVRLVCNAVDMPSLMTRADVAISAGGTTCLEMAFAGLPHLIVVTAENQREAADALTDRGAAHSLGLWETLDEQAIAETLRSLMEDRPRRATMSRRGQTLIDGRGAARCLTAMEEIPHAARCHR